MDEKRRVLSIDLETFSDIDLSSCGVYRYVEGDFHILLFAYAFDDEDVRVVDMACGEELPQEVQDAIFDETVIKAAWNAQFERTCLSRYFGTQLSPDSWQCSMVWAASLSLPLKLKTAAEVLKTGEQKDDAGERLIKYFSVPCKPTKTNGGRTRNLPEHAPEDWALFKSYCMQDVRTERDIRHKLEAFPLQKSEWNFYHMDQRINDRGVLIDKKLVEQAITCDMMLSEEMTAKAYELTGLENPNSVSQLKGWLTERGIDVDSLGKKNVTALIKDLDKHSIDSEALEMMRLRLQMAKSSVKKYQAADRYICLDGRAHGLFQFSGANRTQRWAGRGIQLQNLPQNHISTLDEARELVKLGCFDMVESIYGNTPDILSQLIRTMLICMVIFFVNPLCMGMLTSIAGRELYACGFEIIFNPFTDILLFVWIYQMCQWTVVGQWILELCLIGSALFGHIGSYAGLAQGLYPELVSPPENAAEVQP